MLRQNDSLVAVNQRTLASLTGAVSEIDYNPYGIYRRDGRSGLSGLGDDGVVSAVGSDVVDTILTGGDAAITSAISNAIATKSGGTVDPVPVQNKITLNVLAPVSNALQMPAIISNAAALQALYQFITNNQNQWNAFIAQNWSSRAQAAQQTLAPYFSGLEQSIQTKLAALGSSATPAVIPGTNIPYPTSSLTTSGMLILAVGAWFVLRKVL